ncbi:MAG: Fic family protein [Nitriliruptorales bacterium]
MQRTVPVEWQRRTVEAADPPPIADANPELTTTTVRRTEQAAAAVTSTSARTEGPFDVVGRLLLRAEGLASSAIEGLRASPADVAMAAAGVEADDHVATWVADNLAVVADALATPAPLTVPTLLAWHRRLMRNARRVEERHVGAWRDAIGWVGGANPLVAAHVGAPPQAIAPLMQDLVAFLSREDIDPVSQAAVAHAQFETIHPFADGNGRIGRVLIGWVFARRLEVRFPPPVSTEFARDIGGYLSGLALYRQDQVDAWVRWFADAVAAAAASSGRVLDALDELHERWAKATAHLRADSAARRLLPLLPARPVVSAPHVAELLPVSRPAALAALESLAAAGVLVEVEPATVGTGRPRRWWVAEELLDLLGR